MREPAVKRFRGRDGAELAYREIGSGRPAILLHGYLVTASSWFRSGHAERLAERGFRVIAPDLRGHGDSSRSHDRAAYPPDALVEDGFALIEHLDLSDYDLVGYSLGARLVVRMMALGAQPRRAVVAGTGLEPIVHAAGRGDRYRRLLSGPGPVEVSSADARAQSYLQSIGADPVALRYVLDTFADTPLEDIARISTPTLVVAGIDDIERGSVPALAAALPHGQHATVPGDHVTAMRQPLIGEVIADYLATPDLSPFPR